VRGRAYAREKALGWIPRSEDLDFEGLKGFGREQYWAVRRIDHAEWRRELLLHEELFEKLYDKLPKEFQHMRQLLQSNLWRSPEDTGLAPER